MILQTTLSLAAAAALINIWHMMRTGRVRSREKVLFGDGGNPALIRRMRAHANFIENAPLVLILVAVIEIAGKGGQWLAIVGGAYMAGRVAHGFGMDAEGPHPGRIIGTLLAMLTLAGLAIVAVLIALGRF